MIVRSIDQQVRKWVSEARSIYRVRLTVDGYRKTLFGARHLMATGQAERARRFVYRQFSKRWQYLHDDEIAEFISEAWGVECIPAEERHAA